MNWFDKIIFCGIIAGLLYVSIAWATPKIVDCVEQATPHIRRWDFAYRLGVIAERRGWASNGLVNRESGGE